MSLILYQEIKKRVELSDPEFETILPFFTEQRLKRKEYLLRQGDVCRYETFIVQGCVKSFHSDAQGNEHILRFSQEGQWAGDLESFLQEGPSAFSMQALEPTVLLTITKASLAACYHAVPKFEIFFRQLNENALMATSRRVMDHFSLPARERYVQFTVAHPDLANRVPLKDIASYLGITPVFLSMLRKELAENP